ncbi:hypothetical protein GEMRC1_009599 [Eukaryota sp. GEM-RC1]
MDSVPHWKIELIRKLTSTSFDIKSLQKFVTKLVPSEPEETNDPETDSIADNTTIVVDASPSPPPETMKRRSTTPKTPKKVRRSSLTVIPDSIVGSKKKLALTRDILWNIIDEGPPSRPNLLVSAARGRVAALDKFGNCSMFGRAKELNISVTTLEDMLKYLTKERHVVVGSDGCLYLSKDGSPSI